MDPRKIESKSNALLKLARNVREGRDAGRMFVEGARLSQEAIDANVDVEACLVESGFFLTHSRSHLLESVENRKLEIFELGRSIFSSIAATTTSQGVVLICKRPPDDEREFSKRALAREGSKLSFIIMLSEVNNPANLGAVIRTAEAAGAAGVIVTANSTDAFSSKALRGSMGSAFRTPIWANATWPDVVGWARSNRFALVGATLDGKHEYLRFDWSQPTVLVLGSEAHGLSEPQKASLAATIRVPMEKPVESLNLAVAAGVIAFEARRQAASKP
jgi:TrmH family RNA methyltransferase